MSNLPVIDLIFVILVVLMVIRAYMKGFIAEIFSWAKLVLAIWAAVLFHPVGAQYIRKRIMENVRYVPEILAFIAIFFIVVLLLKMLEHVLKDIVSGAVLGGVNKTLGAVFGLIEGLTLVALIIFILSIQPFFDAVKILGDSIFAQILLPIIKIPLEKGRGVINAAALILPGVRFPVFPA